MPSELIRGLVAPGDESPALDALLAALHADGGSKAVVAAGPGTRVDPWTPHPLHCGTSSTRKGATTRSPPGDRYQVVPHVDNGGRVRAASARLGGTRRNAGGCGLRDRAARGRRGRSRGNAGDERRLGPFRQRVAARRRRTLPHGTQPTPAVAPDGRALFGCARCAVRRHSTGRAVRGQPDSARGGGRESTSPWRPRGAWRATPPPSRCATGPGANPRRRTPVAHRPARPAPGAGGPRPAVPLPPAAATAARTPITLRTGPTATGRRSTTWGCSAPTATKIL